MTEKKSKLEQIVLLYTYVKAEKCICDFAKMFDMGDCAVLVWRVVSYPSLIFSVQFNIPVLYFVFHSSEHFMQVSWHNPFTGFG